MKHSVQERRLMIERDHCQLSISEQCRLLSLHRSGFYYKPCEESEQTQTLMKLIDRIFLELPFTGQER